MGQWRAGRFALYVQWGVCVVSASIVAKGYNFALSELGTFEGVTTPTYHDALRNDVGVSTITLYDTPANQALLGNANLYLIHVFYTSPAGNPLALAQVVFPSGDVKSQINMAGDKIEITGPDLMIEWKLRRLYDAVISFGYADPRVGESPWTDGLLWIDEGQVRFNDPSGGVETDYARWIIQTANTTGGVTQAQISHGYPGGPPNYTVSALIDSNYFESSNGWSNGSPAMGANGVSLFSFRETTKDFDQLLYFSGLDSDGWSIVDSGGSPLEGTDDGTYTSAYGDNALERMQAIARQAGGYFYIPLDTPTRELVFVDTATATGVTLSNDGTTGANRGHIVGGDRQWAIDDRLTRMQVFGAGTGPGALRLAHGQANIEALPGYPDADIVVDWQNSVLYASGWETRGRRDSAPLMFPEIRPLNEYDDSYADAAVFLYQRGLQEMRSQDPEYEYARLEAYLFEYDLYPNDQITVDYSDKGLTGSWYVGRITRGLTQRGVIKTTLQLISAPEAYLLLSPEEKIVNISRAQWQVATSSSSGPSTGGSFGGGGGTSGGTGLVPHDINGGYHTGMPLDWDNVGKTGSDLADLETKSHGDLEDIAADDHHDPVTHVAPITLTGQKIGLDSSLLAGIGLDTEGVALDVQTGDGITISADAVTFDPGDGMQILSNKGAVKASDFAGDGLTASSNDLHVGTPSSLSVSSTNSVTTSSHTHAVTASSAPGAASALLKSDASGYLQLQRLGLNVAPSYPLHIQDSGTQARIAFDASNYVDLIVGSDGTLTIDTETGGSGGAVQLMWDALSALRSDNYVSQTTGWGITYGDSGAHADFRSIFADELHVLAFIAEVQRAFAGAFILTKSVSRLTRNVTIPALAGSSVRIYVENIPGFGGMEVFEAGDDVAIGLIDTTGGGLIVTTAWGTVSDYNGGGDEAADEQSWLFTLSTGSGGGGLGALAGAPVLDYGVDGDGYIKMTTIDSASKPYLMVALRGANPRTDKTVRGVFGDLNAKYGYTGETWGFAAGEYATGKPWLAVDSTNGIRIMRGTTGEQLGKWDTSGNILIGKTGSGNGNLYIDATGDATWRLDTDERIKVSTAGWLRVGEVGAGLGNLLINPAGDSHWRINTTRKVSIEADGDVLIGTDTTDPSTTHLAVFSTAQTYNGESVGVGDILWGDNSSDEFNEFWDLSAGQRYIRDGTTNRVGFSQRGMHWYGSLFGGWDDNSLITFQRLDSPTSSVGGMHAYANASVRQFYLEIESDPAYSALNSGLQLFAHGLGDSSSRAYLFSDVVHIDAADYIETDAPHVYIAKDITFGATYNSSHGSKRYVDTGFGDTVEVSFTVPCVPPLTNATYNGFGTVTAGSAVIVDAQDWNVPDGATGVFVYVKNSWSSASASNYFQIRAIGGQPAVETVGIAAGGSQSASGFVGLDASGQFKLYAGGNNATSVRVSVTGYTI